MELLARTCHYERMNVQRIAARLFILAGGLFWMTAAFGATFSYRDQDLAAAVSSALVPLAIAAVAFIVGWFYETLAAALLGAGVIGVIVWGLLADWEAGVWGVNAVVLIAPMVIAAILLLLAARMQRICSLEERA